VWDAKANEAVLIPIVLERPLPLTVTGEDAFTSVKTAAGIVEISRVPETLLAARDRILSLVILPAS
jgi:hypothetical protein